MFQCEHPAPNGSLNSMQYHQKIRNTIKKLSKSEHPASVGSLECMRFHQRMRNAFMPTYDFLSLKLQLWSL